MKMSRSHIMCENKWLQMKMSRSHIMHENEWLQMKMSGSHICVKMNDYKYFIAYHKYCLCCAHYNVLIKLNRSAHPFIAQDVLISNTYTHLHKCFAFYHLRAQVWAYWHVDYIVNFCVDMQCVRKEPFGATGKHMILLYYYWLWKNTTNVKTDS